MCRTAINSSLLLNPKLLNVAVVVDIEQQQQYRWFYQCISKDGCGSGWWLYEDRHNDIIERAYQKYLKDKGSKFVELQICGSIYWIDLFQNLQIRKNLPLAFRAIKRDNIITTTTTNTKGIAGIPSLFIKNDSRCQHQLSCSTLQR